MRDRAAATTTIVSTVPSGTGTGNGGSDGGRISSDGRYVAFGSFADDLIPGDTNGFGDIFVRDRVAGTIERVSVTSAGAQAAGGYADEVAISGDGRYVAFASNATNLVAGDTNGFKDVFLHDRVGDVTTMVSADQTGSSVMTGGAAVLYPEISTDGQVVTFVGINSQGAGRNWAYDRAVGYATPLARIVQ